MQPFEVVGDVMGDVMGEEYEEIGADPPPRALVHPAGHWRHGPQQGGARGGHPAQQHASAPRFANRAGQNVTMAARPDWRSGQAAPGVMLPDEGLVPLGLVPQGGTPAGTFTAAIQNISYTGTLQKPYRAERLLVSTVRTGASAVGRLLGQFFVGVDLQMGAIAGVDIEILGSPTAFGTRLTMMQAPPGVIISVPVQLSTALAGADTIQANILFTGRIIH